MRNKNNNTGNVRIKKNRLFDNFRLMKARGESAGIKTTIVLNIGFGWSVTMTMSYFLLLSQNIQLLNLPPHWPHLKPVSETVMVSAPN